MAEAGYARPATLREALDLIAGAPANDCLLVAGGTDALVQRKQELDSRQFLIDLSGIDTLRQIRVDQGRLVLGALLTLYELETSSEAGGWCPLLGEAARAIASPTIRYSATVGGNLLVGNRCTFYNQSKLGRESAGTCLREAGPTCLATGGLENCYARNVSDLAPALIALDARVELCNRNGTFTKQLIELYAADGLHAQAGLEPGTILTGVQLARRPARWFFRKLRQRESLDYASLTVAGALYPDLSVRVCVNGVSTMPELVEAQQGEITLSDLQSRVRRSCKTVDNDVMPLKYRREMIDVYLEDLWRSLGPGSGR